MSTAHNLKHRKGTGSSWYDFKVLLYRNCSYGKIETHLNVTKKTKQVQGGKLSFKLSEMC